MIDILDIREYNKNRIISNIENEKQFHDKYNGYASYS